MSEQRPANAPWLMRRPRPRCSLAARRAAIVAALAAMTVGVARAAPTAAIRPPPTIAAITNVQQWLTEHPRIGAAVRWQQPDGTILAQSEWPPPLQDRFQAIF